MDAARDRSSAFDDWAGARVDGLSGSGISDSIRNFSDRAWRAN